MILEKGIAVHHVAYFCHPITSYNMKSLDKFVTKGKLLKEYLFNHIMEYGVIGNKQFKFQ